jgi:phosphate transport system protein
VCVRFPRESIKKMASVDLEKNLKRIEREVISVGSMVEEAIDRSVDSLKTRDLTLAVQVVENDSEIDRRCFAIEQDCMKVISDLHPRGRDLRIIVATIGIVGELERMADYAEGIANITLMIGDQPPLKPLVDIPRMAEKGTRMLRKSLDSFSERDVGKAKTVAREDDEIDVLYDQVFRELLLFMVEDPTTITRATRLIWAAHNLERFADRATNICERVVFAVTGKLVDIGASKY